jgi:GTP-binding protein
VDALEAELAQYTPSLGTDLATRPRMIALNKIDVADGKDLADMVRSEFESRGLPVFEISAATREGLREFNYALAAVVEQARADRPPAAPTRIVLRPTAVNDTGFTVEPDPDEPDGFVVRGERPERWIRQTNFDNDEAVGYLADRLARLGVEDRLAKLGAIPGSAVTIGNVTFEWEPSTPAGIAAVTMAHRGTDPRLERDHRVGAADRKAARRVRRGQVDPIEDDE